MATQGIPVVGPLLNRIIGSRNDRFVKKYTTRVASINALEAETRQMTDGRLRAKLVEFRERHDKGQTSEDFLVDAFAIAREVMDRSVGIRSIFNPDRQFDASRLNADARAMYDETRAAMEATPIIYPRTYVGALPEGTARETEDRFLGHSSPVPGWMQVEIPPKLYDAVRELIPESRPPFRSRPFDVQLIGAMVLSGGKIAEMKTGEGKTIVGPLACYLAAIERMKIHVVTVNDYLVQRDRDWTFPFFHWLGLNVGAIHPMHMQPEDLKRLMYRCDVVYGTTAEFGFDYLRDNMKRSTEQQVQRKRQFAIVDEVDSILIDEARTPLIISGPAHEDLPRYELADRLARHLVEKQRPWNEADEIVQACKRKIKGIEGDIRQVRDKGQIPELQKQLAAAKEELPGVEQARDRHTQYYELHLERKSCHVTHDGVAEAQRVANIGSFYVGENMDVPHLLEQSLRAHAVYYRDRDYIVMDVQNAQTGRPEPSIVIVDVNTGRPMIGRQWSDGLHQAIECKEKVPIKQETQTVATITIQNFFKMYKRLAGMTGTADTEAQEFHDIYKLDVVAIPTNRSVVRRDFNDTVYLTGKDKWNAIVDEIKAFNDVGRPILVGTTSVEKSETLSQMLTRRHGVKHDVLNAKQHEREAHIVENAGQLGQVMIATNMAGRGTDIKLGTLTREAQLEHWLKRGICPRTVTIESSDEQLREGIYRKVAQTDLEMRKQDAEQTPYEELELRLLRHWATKYTMVGEKQAASMDAESLRKELDTSGRFLLHRIRWFTSIEDLGGLHVIGTERHESRRIDNQLRGRSGRQGDKGSSRFYVALDDDLMKMFAGETTMRILARMGMREGDAIEHPMLNKSVERAQRKVEERNFQIRKNILEYDEVMEHQRQTFYGLRQRVLDGRDVKGLIFEYLEGVVDDACDEYLDKHYATQCAATFAGQKLSCEIPPDRLRGKDKNEIEILCRREAVADANTVITVTLGEYMPTEGSDVEMDFDSAGLIRWASNRFGVEIAPEEVKEPTAEVRRAIQERLSVAAQAKIEETDLSGLDAFFAPDYGAKTLATWAMNKFGLEISADEIVKAEESENSSARDAIMARVSEMYREREVTYPVEFRMEITMMAAQRGPLQALEALAAWARRRFGVDWTADTLKSTPPPKVRDMLLEQSKAFVERDQLQKDIDEAMAFKTDEELDAHLKAKYGGFLPENLKYLTPDERPDAVRALIENVQRAELVNLERTIVLDILDQTWRDHLYAMDQLRDAIGFRAFSQQDPRIAYKRDGSALFNTMLGDVRERVSDYIFKARVSAASLLGHVVQSKGGPAMPPLGGSRGPTAAPPATRGPAMGPGGITGPGLDG
ncbi:MAG: preprotein translocase subunit SecA [Phycisphaeraceae bacterium]|nr:preprotein translocase subunit SecA [Phycisphaeraceae bacterium]